MNIAKRLKLTWNAPTTDVDGSSLDGPITYEVQFTRGVEVVTFETSELMLDELPIDIGLSVGLWSVVVFSIETEDGTELRSVAGNRLEFELTATSNPNAPTGLTFVIG